MFKISDAIDFIYGYLLFKSYFFCIKTNINATDYPNKAYTEKWRAFTKTLNEDDLIKALKLITKKSESAFSRVLDIYDCFDRSSYFALINSNHPNITLGFVKDADLWDVWLSEGIYKLVRDAIAEYISKGDKVVDFGCGSISPAYYGDIVGFSGVYTGVDYSRPLLNLANIKIKEERISDRVNLVQGYVDSKLIFKRSYDVAICSSILQYANLKSTLTNAVNALNGEGVIIIFSEVFMDIDPEKAKLFELYYSLIPPFKKFPSVKEICEILGSLCDFECKLIGRNFLKIDIRESFRR